jgi:pyruvate dehydrogenase E2 component (dihydrolipoamide acetyltransferase)
MAGKKSSDPNIFLLPDIGEGLQEAEIVRWMVKVGDTVEENQSLAEVNTDKALTEIPSPRAGTIAALHGADGEVVKIGDPFVTYAANGAGAGVAAQRGGSTQPRTAEQHEADPDHHLSHDVPDHTPERTEDAGTVVGKVGSDLAGVSADGKALATPAVRRIARDLGVDINTVPGTGIGGRVTEKDVRAAGSPALRAGSPTPSTSSASARPAARSTAPTQPMPPRAPASVAPSAPSRPPMPAMPPGQDTQRIPVRGIRRNIAQALRNSVNNAVHFNVMDEADVTALDDLRRRLAAASGEKVSFLPFVCSAVARALTGEFGALNAWMDDEKGEIVRHRSVHLGIATDTEQGLMVPVVRDADRMGVLEIGRSVNATAKAARDKSITRENLSGSTFTISNVGSYAGRFATPIINYPEVGILAVGRTREGMVVKDGWFRVGKLMPLSLACDHRVVDGATAALALAKIVELLQEPEGLMAPAR